VVPGGSAVGLGSDIGGSVRLPASACGIHALKPTAHRLPLDGHDQGMLDLDTIVCQPGPMARHVEDLDTMMRILLDDQQHTLQAFQDIDVPSLRIGYFTDNDVMRCSVAIADLVHRAAQTLSNLGAQTLQWQPPRFTEAWSSYIGLLFGDGAQRYLALLGDTNGEALDACSQRVVQCAQAPNALKRMLARGCSLAGETQYAASLRGFVKRKYVASACCVDGRVDVY
jgi:fatty acid amide hydrolase